MTKRAEIAVVILFIIALFALSTGYDFWRGYREAHSYEGGIASVVFGLMVLAVLGIVHLLRGK
jgi:hypothetical protein